jgi:hypothetical protein
MSQPTKNYPGRNRHHLVPKHRGGTREPTNMLLIHIERHEHWHKVFGTRTLDEVIALLTRLKRMKRRRK